ncbi:MAG TPA: pirin family protein [Kofleriaceae bacterium]|nr:pirin family protein [Kofleriaceae bacterium]
MTVTLRRAADRGHADHGWLNSFHTFSFADYHDPKHMGFRALRVINDDTVAPGRGFGAHPHRDMEIISYVLDGELAHKDSMGNGSVIRPGDVQRMSAGTGVVHSELNPSRTTPVHFLQIWIQPDRAGHPPGYEQKAYPPEERQGRLRLVASPDGADGSVTIHQDARLYAGNLADGDRAQHVVAAGRHAWIHVARGEVALGEEVLRAGDAARTSDAGALELRGRPGGGEVLVFDLA